MMRGDSMEKQTTQKRNKAPVTLIVQREFIGEKKLSEMMFPIIYEDLRKKIECRTLDNEIKKQ